MRRPAFVNKKSEGVLSGGCTKGGLPWLWALCVHPMAESGAGSPSGNASKIRIVDGTIVKEPGKTGSQWRILYTTRLPELGCDFFDVTTVEGPGNGESRTRIPAQSGELMPGDTIYGRLSGVLAMKQIGADILFRVNPTTFAAYGPGKRQFNLLRSVTKPAAVGKVCEWKVWLSGSSGGEVVARLCVIRKSEEAIRRAQRRLHRKKVQKANQTEAGNLRIYTPCHDVATYEQGSAAQFCSCIGCGLQIELAVVNKSICPVLFTHDLSGLPFFNKECFASLPARSRH